MVNNMETIVDMFINFCAAFIGVSCGVSLFEVFRDKTKLKLGDYIDMFIIFMLTIAGHYITTYAFLSVFYYLFYRNKFGK